MKKLVIISNIKELFIRNKIREGDLLAINTAGVKGYYSFSDKKTKYNEKSCSTFIRY